MFFRKSKLIRELYAEIQRLREALAQVVGERDSARQGFEGMREVAAKAIEAAKEKHFEATITRYDDGGTDIQLNTESGMTLNDFDEIPNHTFYLPDYIAPEVKNCPECSVSVRSDSWPQECPACHCVFGFEENE